MTRIADLTRERSLEIKIYKILESCFFFRFNHALLADTYLEFLQVAGLSLQESALSVKFIIDFAVALGAYIDY